MADPDKTEAPTPKRLQEARKKGQVPVSKDLTSAIGLVMLMGTLAFLGGTILNSYKELLSTGLIEAGKPTDVTINSITGIVSGIAWKALFLVGMPIAAAVIASVLVGLVQTKFLFSAKALVPNFKKLNPVEGVKRIFGYRGIFEALKEFAKVTVIGLTAFAVIWPDREKLARTTGMPPNEILPYLAGLTLKLGFAVALSFLVIAAADWFFQRYQHTRELRMTKEEVKQELKQTDMSPEIKRLIKQRQGQTARRRMMQAIPEADVVITNPTHYAVALKYDSTNPAPQVVAKGQDLIAQQIREKAIENDVDVVSNPPLARSLHSSCEVGHFIPVELFTAVAEVLAFVYQRRDQRKRYLGDS